ncbi:HAD family hydrolase [Methanospirillum purgamenti]|uniref:D,D-heptose 1,7-bisphosphate phosphatase n=1 Tax=Methanospirillum hungatei TaxID=2203 RepID=A0A8F5ZDP6_METHU|nr:HAD family hydrolase [Methanospirillum hungatei]QXO93535.1 HAD family hydrolase [Methanospirillum hungatei]
MESAVFLDRDGTLNDLVLNQVTNEYEPPHSPEELIFLPNVIQSLCALQKAGFKLFVISNQPDYAKGKTTLQKLKDVHHALDQMLKKKGINIEEYYYCYHHPNGIIPDYSFQCECRKPSPYFIKKASKKFNIEIHNSWMIGDRDSDIECGIAAGVKTILVKYPLSVEYQKFSSPGFIVKNLKESIEIILENWNKV